MREAMKDKENKIFSTVSGIIFLFAFIGTYNGPINSDRSGDDS
jgi:hypothetical protein